MSSSSRGIRVVGRDHYESDARLAAHVARITAAHRRDPGTLVVDPCAGHGSLYRELEDPKCAFDLVPQFEGCERQDFLTSRRPRKVRDLMLVMNPPFSMARQRNGVIAFLNHAAEHFLGDDEVVVTVAPHSMRRWVNIRKVDARMRLVEEHVLTRPCTFQCETGRTTHVNIGIQVWRRCSSGDAPRVDPDFLRSNPRFAVRCFPDRKDSRPIFFLKRWGSTNRVGAVAAADTFHDGKCGVGTVHEKAGTAYCIHGDAEVLRTFEHLYASGAWSDYCRHTSAGSNNPNLNVHEVYSIFSRGAAYYAKPRWGIKVFLVRDDDHATRATCDNGKEAGNNTR